MRKSSVCLAVILGVLLLTSLSMAQMRVGDVAEDEEIDSEALTTEEETTDEEVDMEELATEEDEDTEDITGVSVANCFIDWMSASAYQNEFNRQAANRFYPVAVEGRNQAGQSQFRATFVPFPVGVFSFQSHHGITREFYVQRNLELLNQGYTRISVQSFTDLFVIGRYQATWVKGGCSNAKFLIPHQGKMGWPYMDPGEGIPPDVIDEDGTIHRGIDIVGNDHDPVYAPYDGEVVAEDSSFRIRHPALGVDTYYGHVTKTLPRSTQVKRGCKVAELLPDGSNTHLHFTITKLVTPGHANELKFRNSIDPSPFFNAKLNFFDGTRRFRRTVSGWCNTAPVGIIRGVVKTPDGIGVSDATVKIEGTKQSRTTDYWMGPNDNGNNTTWQNLNQGRYIFSNAPVGKVKITASKPDVGSGSVEVTVKASTTIKAQKVPDIILR